MKINIDFDIYADQALEILCKTLDMEFALDDSDAFYIKDCPKTGEPAVWLGNKVYDDRVDLFIALRNLMVCMIPNLEFRSADYIYRK